MHIVANCQPKGVISNQALRLGHCLAACGFILALFVGPLSAEQCSADCSHPEKACLCVVDPGTSTISLTPIGTVERQAAKLGQALEIGDELVNTAADAVVELACPGGSEVKLHGQFRAVIMPGAEGQDCAFNLLAGAADVLTDKPTQLESGEAIMGSKRTQYSMRVSRSSDAANVECLVFEGEAEVRSKRGRWTRDLTSSSKALWSNGRMAGNVNPVSQRDIEAASAVYARTDVARLRTRGIEVVDPQTLRTNLAKSYAAVLARPNEAQPRIELAVLQADSRITKQALYHLTKAEKLEPARAEEKVAIAATKFVAYKQIGQEQEAAVESEKVRKLDPATYERLRKLDPAVLKPGAISPTAQQPRTADPATQQLRTDPSLQRSRTADSTVQKTAAADLAVQPSRTAAASVTRETRTSTAVSATTQQAAQTPSLRSPARTRLAIAPIVVKALSRPSTVAAGEWTTIVVTAVTQDGQPVPGATVTVSAGGGAFRESRSTQVGGVTDARGFFQTSWMCQPCAPAYGIGVEISKDGLAAGKADVTVKIQ